MFNLLVPLILIIGCKRDSEGYYWITGRTDDCMNVAGHLLSTAQIESALVEHDAVTEAAVVSVEAQVLIPNFYGPVNELTPRRVHLTRVGVYSLLLYTALHCQTKTWHFS